MGRRYGVGIIARLVASGLQPVIQAAVAA